MLMSHSLKRSSAISICTTRKANQILATIKVADFEQFFLSVHVVWLGGRTLQPAVRQVAMPGHVVGAEAEPVVVLLGVAAVQHAVEVVERQARQDGLELGGAELLQVAPAVRVHAVAELRQTVADRQHRLLHLRVERNPEMRCHF